MMEGWLDENIMRRLNNVDITCTKIFAAAVTRATRSFSSWVRSLFAFLAAATACVCVCVFECVWWKDIKLQRLIDYQMEY